MTERALLVYVQHFTEEYKPALKLTDNASQQCGWQTFQSMFWSEARGTSLVVIAKSDSYLYFTQVSDWFRVCQCLGVD